jgi:hypothetical protein
MRYARLRSRSCCLTMVTSTRLSPLPGNMAAHPHCNS